MTEEGAASAAVDAPVGERGTGRADLLRWWALAEIGARGRYAAAHSGLETLGAGLRGRAGVSATARAVLSLSLSARASLLRQVGAHARARPLDGVAYRLVAADLTEGSSTATWMAACDALTGLAADCLGDPAGEGVPEALLERVDGLLGAREGDDGGAGGESIGFPSWRPHLRRLWVGAESAMARGNWDAARDLADRATALARGCPSPRHRVKTALVAAASRCVLDPAGATARADAVSREAAMEGLLPLRWAASMLLRGIASDGRVRADAETARQVAERLLERWGAGFGG